MSYDWESIGAFSVDPYLEFLDEVKAVSSGTTDEFSRVFDMSIFGLMVLIKQAPKWGQGVAVYWLILGGWKS